MAELPGIHYDKAKTYHKEVILKKEGKIWIEYYAVLVDKNLVFNRKDSKTGQIIPHNVTMIEISNKTFCGFDDNKKKCYRFPFWVETGKTKYQFKCETKLHRHKWLFAIRLCAGGKPPVPVPKMIPTVQRSKQQRKTSDTNKLNRSRNLTYNHGSRDNNNNASSSSSTASNNKTLAAEQKFTHKRSKSMETCLANVTEKENKDHQKVQKTLSIPTTKESLKRSRSLIERSNKSSEKDKDKVKTTSWKLRFTTRRSKSKPDVKDSVVENRNVKDSMSDVHTSSSQSSNPVVHENLTVVGTEKVKTIIVQPGINGKMTLNDRFKSMSCDDVLQVERTQVEHLTKSINGSFIGIDPPTPNNNGEEKNLKQGTLASKWKSVDELYLDDEGRKTPNDHSSTMVTTVTDEGIVDLRDDGDCIPDLKKEPCENDEMDYPQQPPHQQQRPSSHTNNNTKRDVTELFKAKSSRRYSSTQSISSVDSNHVHSSPLKRRSKKKGSIVSLFSLKMERANSWASFPGRKKTVEPIQRRENSAPSLKGNRSRRQSNF